MYGMILHSFKSSHDGNIQTRKYHGTRTIFRRSPPVIKARFFPPISPIRYVPTSSMRERALDKYREHPRGTAVGAKACVSRLSKRE